MNVNVNLVIMEMVEHVSRSMLVWSINVASTDDVSITIHIILVTATLVMMALILALVKIQMNANFQNFRDMRVITNVTERRHFATILMAIIGKFNLGGNTLLGNRFLVMGPYKLYGLNNIVSVDSAAESQPHHEPIFYIRLSQSKIGCRHFESCRYKVYFQACPN